MKHVCCVLLYDMWASSKDQTAFVSKNPPIYLLLPYLSICSHIISYPAPRLPMFGDCFLPQTEKILEVSGITKCWSNIKALLMYMRTSHMVLDHSYPDSLHSFSPWSCIGNWSLPVLLPYPPFCEFNLITSYVLVRFPEMQPLNIVQLLDDICLAWSYSGTLFNQSNEEQSHCLSPQKPGIR